MKENSRIRFNPVTKEIEVEGSESFVKTYFGKIQAMISGAREKKILIKKEPKAVKATPAKKAEKKPKVVKARRVKKARKAAKEVKPVSAKRVRKIGKRATAKKRATVGTKRGSLSKAVLDLINGSTEGIAMAELKGKTGLKDSQIRNIISSVIKQGKVGTVKRGVYVGISEAV